MTSKIITITLLILMLVIASVGHGQEKSGEDLAKATQNPLASMISLPFQNNTNFGIGPDDDT